MPDDMNTETPAVAPAPEGATSESVEQVTDQSHVQTQERPEPETGTNGQVGEVPKDNAAWAAQRVANKQLKEENERLKQVVESVDPRYLESLRGATAPQEILQYQVPRVTGDAEYSQVTDGVNFAAQQAVQARNEAAKLRQQLELQQDREAERAFPELKTDKGFQQLVAEKKLAARVLGHERTTYEIAEEVKRLLGRREEQLVAKTAQETEQQISQRHVISTEPRGRTTAGTQSGGSEELRMRVRRGDSQAQIDTAKSLIADLEF